VCFVDGEKAMNLDKLNSLTKYPSIPTYHELGDRGRVKPDAPPQVSFEGETVVVTEKVDGTNGRIVFLPGGVRTPGDWFIGAREEFLTAKGDRVPNTQLGIVEVLRPLAARIVDTVGVDRVLRVPVLPGFSRKDYATVVFAEVYGISGAGSSWKQYTTTGRGSCHIFDIAWCPLAKLDLDRDAIASWRDHGGQEFLDEEGLATFATATGLEDHLIVGDVELTPRRALLASLPTTPNDVRTWLAQYSKSACVLEPDAPGRSEGVVVRTISRSKIAKIRFENYQSEPERRKKG